MRLMQICEASIASRFTPLFQSLSLEDGSEPSNDNLSTSEASMGYRITHELLVHIDPMTGRRYWRVDMQNVTNGDPFEFGCVYGHQQGTWHCESRLHCSCICPCERGLDAFGNRCDDCESCHAYRFIETNLMNHNRDLWQRNVIQGDSPLLESFAEAKRYLFVLAQLRGLDFDECGPDGSCIYQVASMYAQYEEEEFFLKYLERHGSLPAIPFDVEAARAKTRMHPWFDADGKVLSDSQILDRLARGELRLPYGIETFVTYEAFLPMMRNYLSEMGYSE